MRRLAAARAICEAFAARVMLRVSAIRTNRASEVRLGRIAYSPSTGDRPLVPHGGSKWSVPGLGKEAAGGDGAAEVARQRQGIAGEQGGDELGAERRPQQPSRAEAGRGVNAGERGLAEDRQAVGDGRAEAGPAREGGRVHAGGESRKERLGAPQVRAVILGADP